MKWRPFTITLWHPDGSIYCRVSRFGIRSAVKRLRDQELTINRFMPETQFFRYPKAAAPAT